MSAFDCGPWMFATGGESQGGPATLVPPSGMFAYGGERQGGIAVQGDEGTCSPVPVVVGGTARPHIDGDDDVAFPVGTVADDVVLLFAWQEDSASTATTSAEWTPLVSDTNAGATNAYTVWYQVWDGSTPAIGSVTGTPGVEIRLSCVSVRGSGVPFVDLLNKGISDEETALSIDVADCPCLLLMYAIVDDLDSAYNTPTGMAAVAPDPAQTPSSVWQESGVGPGASGDRTVTPASGTDWAALLIVCPAPPP